jgi:hypothetical protein
MTTPSLSPSPLQRTALCNAIMAGKTDKVRRMLENPKLAGWLKHGKNNYSSPLYLALAQKDIAMTSLLLGKKALVDMNALREVLTRERLASPDLQPRWKSFRDTCLARIRPLDGSPEDVSRLYAMCGNMDAVFALQAWGAPVPSKGQDGLITALVHCTLERGGHEGLLAFIRQALDAGFGVHPMVAALDHNDVITGDPALFMAAIDILDTDDQIGFRSLSQFLQPGRFHHALTIIRWSRQKAALTSAAPLDGCWRMTSHGGRASARGHTPLEWMFEKVGEALGRGVWTPEDQEGFEAVLTELEKEGFSLDSFPSDPVVNFPWRRGGRRDEGRAVPSTVRAWVESQLPEVFVLVEKRELQRAIERGSVSPSAPRSRL